MNILPRPIHHSLCVYVLLAAMISLSSTIAVAFLIDVSGVNDCGAIQERRSWLHSVMSGMILSPIVESALLTAVVRWVAALSEQNRYASILVPALSASVIHGAFCLWWGLAVIPAFIVYARAVVDYREVSWTKACLATSLVHVLHNTVAILLGWVLE